MAHLQKKNNKIEFEFMFLALARAPRSADVKEEKERIMMFASMVNSRFYARVLRSFPSRLVKLPLQKLLLFLVIANRLRTAGRGA